MKEPAMITCPHCGKQTAAADVCRHCGKNIGTLQGLEVQYRDFKGSEMLDIKMSPPGRHEEDERPGPKGAEAADSCLPSEKKEGKGRTFLFFGAAVLIIIAALAWYYVLKFLLKF